MDIQSTGDLAHEGTQNFLIYGPPGVGKTYMIRTCDGPTLLLSAESGEISLADVDIDYATIRSMDDLIEAYTFLADNPGTYTWVCLDSISEMAEICLADEMDRHKDPRQAYGEMAKRVRKAMRLFRALDVNVYFSAKQTKTQSDGRMLYAPSFPGNQLTNASPVAHDFDHVFGMGATADEEGLDRWLVTEPREGYVAKVRDPFGQIDAYEPPNLGAIRRKIINANPNNGDDQ